jgi:HK97 family phage prohead protease
MEAIMSDIVRKIITCEVKEVGERTLEFVGSTETPDRDGEVIKASGWDVKNYRKNPVFMFAHRYDQPPIGKAQKVWVEDTKLKFQIEFADKDTYEFADTIYKLYKGGFMKATSVGFIPDMDAIEEGDGEKAPRRTYTKQELLELSAVPVPSNPDALVQAREAGLITVKEFEAISVEKPYPNEHSCRLRSPDDFQADSFRRTSRESDGKRYDVIMGRLKGETTMTEQAYRYPKDIWAAGEAKNHCKEHEGAFEAAMEEAIMGSKSAIPYKKTPLAPEDEKWDASAEVREADVDDLKIMCTWVGDEPDLKTSYKLPHHKAAGQHACVWAGVRAVAAVLMGARGGIDIPDNDLPGVKRHIARHYADFDKGEPPWERSISQAEIKDELDYTRSLIETGDLSNENEELAWEIVREVMRISGADIPVDILSKAGAVLNAKNRENLKQAQTLIQSVLDSAEKPGEENLDLTDIAEIAAQTVERLIGKH